MVQFSINDTRNQLGIEEEPMSKLKAFKLYQHKSMRDLVEYFIQTVTDME